MFTCRSTGQLMWADGQHDSPHFFMCTQKYNIIPGKHTATLTTDRKRKNRIDKQYSIVHLITPLFFKQEMRQGTFYSRTEIP